MDKGLQLLGVVKSGNGVERVMWWCPDCSVSGPETTKGVAPELKHKDDCGKPQAVG